LCQEKGAVCGSLFNIVARRLGVTFIAINYLRQKYGVFFILPKEVQKNKLLFSRWKQNGRIVCPDSVGKQQVNGDVLPGKLFYFLYLRLSSHIFARLVK